MKNNIMKLNQEAKTVSPHEQMKNIYDQIAKLDHCDTFVQDLQDLNEQLAQARREARKIEDAGRKELALQKVRRIKEEHKEELALYERLGKTLLDFVTYTVKRKSAMVSGLCQAGGLEQDDVVSELAIQLMDKTGYIASKRLMAEDGRTEAPEADQSNYRMALAFTILNRAMTSLWRRFTKHFGKDLGVDPETGERKFGDGIHFSSWEEILENAHEPVPDQPSKDPMPEENLICRENDRNFDDNADQTLRIIRAALTEKQFAAFLIGAEKRGLDPRLTAAWSFDHSALFPNAQSLANAQHLAKKKLNSRAVKDQIIHIFC